MWCLVGITTDEIVANAGLFFVAGYDTTSTSLSFFLYNMALHPEVQDKLMEEITRVVGDKVSSCLLLDSTYLRRQQFNVLF